MFPTKTWVLCLLYLSGCASVVAPGKFQQAKREIASSSATITEPEKTNKLNAAAQDDYDQAIADCAKVMDGMRLNVTGQRGVSVGIATVGIIAGSIVVPTLAAKAAASKSAIAGWGGVSGAANAGQYMLDSNGLSPYQASAIYDEMRKEIKNGMDEYVKAETPEKRAAAINSLTVTCKFQPLPAVTQPKAGT